MSDEREQLSRLLTGLHEEQNGLFRYVTVELGGNTLYIMECGIGKVNAAVGASELITRMQPDVVVSTGVAGGIDKEVAVMDVVAASQVVYHDVWCGMGNEYGQVQGMPPKFACDERLVQVAASLVSPVPVVTPASTAQLTAPEETSVNWARGAWGLPAWFHMNSTAISREQGSSG